MQSSVFVGLLRFLFSRLFRRHFKLLGVLMLFFSVSVSHAANILVVAGTDSLAITAAIRLNTDLSGSNVVTIVQGAVPADLTGYTQIYDVRYQNNPAFTAGEQAQYVAFLNAAAGNMIFLMGENAALSFAARNQAICDFIASAGGGIIAPPAMASANAETVHTPFTTYPNAITTVSFGWAGVVTSCGTGAFIATEGATATGGAIFFAPGTLANALSGGLIVVFDVNFIATAPALGSETSFRQNMEAVVAAGGQTPVGNTKKDQTISFDALANRDVTAGPQTLVATASSGLPVSLTVISGPATIVNKVLTLTGNPGEVIVQATQAGDSVYNLADDVYRRFQVTSASGPKIFFGSVGTGSFAGVFTDDLSSGTLIGYLPSTGEGFKVGLTKGTNGLYTGVATTYVGTQAGSLSLSKLAGSAAATRTFTGTLTGTTLSGTLTELGLSFSGVRQPPTGSTLSLSGYYTAESVGTVNDKVYVVVGTDGALYVLSITTDAVNGSSSTIGASGTFSTTTSAGAQYSGQINVVDTTLHVVRSVTGKVPVSLTGISAATTRTDHLINLSARAFVDDSVPGNGALVSGFSISGTKAKTVLLRGVGPTLASYGVSGPMANPKLMLYDSNGVALANNDDWAGDTAIAAAANQIGAFPLPADSKDASVLITLDPGRYTMHLTDSGGSGVALAEVYDTGTDSYQRLINLSARGLVTAKENSLTAGFIITGNAPKHVLIRGVGPGLAKYGVSGVLADPSLTLYDNAGNVMLKNDNWGAVIAGETLSSVNATTDISTACDAVGAFGLEAGSKDASMLVTLPPGVYTAVLSSADSKAGVALVEVYEVP